MTSPGRGDSFDLALIQVIIRKTSKRIPGPVARAQDAGRVPAEAGPGGGTVAEWRGGIL